jgi:hypothetical protein
MDLHQKMSLNLSTSFQKPTRNMSIGHELGMFLVVTFVKCSKKKGRNTDLLVPTHVHIFCPIQQEKFG